MRCSPTATSTAIPEEEEADGPSILPMTPESKQLAAVIATAVATAMAGKSAAADSINWAGNSGWAWATHTAKAGCFGSARAAAVAILRANGKDTTDRGLVTTTAAQVRRAIRQRRAGARKATARGFFFTSD